MKKKDTKFAILSLQYGMLASVIIQYHPEIVRNMKHLDFLRVRTIDGYLCDILLWSPESVDELLTLEDNTYGAPILISKRTPNNWINQKYDFNLYTIQIIDIAELDPMVYPGEEEEMEYSEEDEK